MREVLKLSKWDPKFSKMGHNSVNGTLNSVKRVLNSVKLVLNSVELTANGRVNLIYSINQPWDPETGSVPTPLGSPTGVQKRVLSTLLSPRHGVG